MELFWAFKVDTCSPNIGLDFDGIFANKLHLPYITPNISSNYFESRIPSGKLAWLWKITIFNGKIHYKWPFSIAMLVYQSVNTGENTGETSPIMPSSPIFIH